MINFKKVLTDFMSAAMVLTSMSIPAFADGEADVAKIGETTYPTLVAAIAEAQSGDVITLLSDASGDGIEIPSNKNLTIDFDTHTYDVKQNLVGSETTKTNAYRFLENSNVTLKNGTIKATASNTFILVQNYSDILRWKTAEKENNGMMHNYDGIEVVKRSFNPKRDYLWPIPYNQTVLNPNLEQNPNWD